MEGKRSQKDADEGAAAVGEHWADRFLGAITIETETMTF